MSTGSTKEEWSAVDNSVALKWQGWQQQRCTTGRHVHPRITQTNKSASRSGSPDTCLCTPVSIHHQVRTFNISVDYAAAVQVQQACCRVQRLHEWRENATLASHGTRAEANAAAIMYVCCHLQWRSVHLPAQLQPPAFSCSFHLVPHAPGSAAAPRSARRRAAATGGPPAAHPPGSPARSTLHEQKHASTKIMQRMHCITWAGRSGGPFPRLPPPALLLPKRSATQ